MFFLCSHMERKSFFYANYLIDRWQVLSYLTRIPLLNQANHAISQKSWSIGIVLTIFSWILELNASKKKEEHVGFRPRLQDERRRQTRFAKSNFFEIGRERQELLLQSRKMAKRWQSFWQTYWNFRGIAFQRAF